MSGVVLKNEAGTVTQYTFGQITNYTNPINKRIEEEEMPGQKKLEWWDPTTQDNDINFDYIVVYEGTGTPITNAKTTLTGIVDAPGRRQLVVTYGDGGTETFYVTLSKMEFNWNGVNTCIFRMGFKIADYVWEI